ncbi:putative UDP-glucosyltransferase [Hibiscus syriacus]|uniref:UDP-glucosyltransferase n=1 Tax=Hibiscus syriacus TaxID=106335 RepID=A0A6A2YP91_HIBSY|nr:putative UDP-glucosyltransferase [Hibiscus syriacus]
MSKIIGRLRKLGVSVRFLLATKTSRTRSKEVTEVQSMNNNVCSGLIHKNRTLHLRMPREHQHYKVSGTDRVGFRLGGIEQAVHLGPKRKRYNIEPSGEMDERGRVRRKNERKRACSQGMGSSSVPLITLPFLGDQFCNQKLAVQIPKTAVSLGVDKPTMFGDEKSGFMLNKEQVQNAIHQLMDEGEEGIERRKRAKEFGVMAKTAVDIEGSSYCNITLFIQDIIQQSQKMSA